jgi:hypothetical protein
VMKFVRLISFMKYDFTVRMRMVAVWQQLDQKQFRADILRLLNVQILQLEVWNVRSCRNPGTPGKCNPAPENGTARG